MYRFELNPGDAYIIPAGMLHEFRNIGDTVRSVYTDSVLFQTTTLCNSAAVSAY
jgi:quercetin dioxygenase-like cupin family protein